MKVAYAEVVENERLYANTYAMWFRAPLIDTARAAVDAFVAALESGGQPAYQVRPLAEYRDGAPA